MNLCLKPYPQCKPSGIDWLGEVPAHWEVRRLRTIAELRVSNVDKHTREDETPVRLCNYVDVYKNDRISEAIEFMQATATPDEIQRFRLDVDDVLITKDSETWDDIGVPALVKYSADDLISGYHLALLRPFKQQISGGYLLRALQSKPVAYQFHVEATGVTRYGLSQDGIKSIWFPLPPASEQRAIVRFLDHIDRRINRLIRAKRRHIELLNEQKQAVIHQAVTRGLDPNVRLKPSGIDWLGDVPEHWEVKKLHYVTDPRRPVMYGIVLPGPNVDEGVYIVKGGNCEPGRLKTENLARTTFEIEAGYVRSRLVGNDIVFAIRGGVGASELVPEELTGANLTQDAARIAARDGVNPKWLLYAVRAPVFHDHVRSRMLGATVQGINIRDLKRIETVVPPPAEQTTIVDFLDKETADIGAEIARAHHEISLLQEYRTRLIADVVTGKLDVRMVELPELDNEDELGYLDVEEEADLDDLDESLEDPDDDQ